MPIQGKRTPRTTIRDNKIIRVVGVNREKDLWDIDEERGDVGDESESGL